MSLSLLSKSSRNHYFKPLLLIGNPSLLSLMLNSKCSAPMPQASHAKPRIYLFSRRRPPRLGMSSHFSSMLSRCRHSLLRLWVAGLVVVSLRSRVLVLSFFYSLVRLRFWWLP
ncbi:hypothetical protein PRUPE_2G089700 [Prunus persica]|uniref:Uncharacterized protein n=1 Tax=Prunus persica TaxID=3760 RepID=A0A251QDB0_PRUPE|nr:hypothetical protein PRUPE_2G089700 [Prunus persica]